MNQNSNGYNNRKLENRNGNTNNIRNNNSYNKTTKDMKNKKKRHIKILPIIIAILVIILIVFAIYYFSNRKVNEEKFVKNFLEEVKENEDVAISKYGMNAIEKEVSKQKYDNLEYEIKEIEKLGEDPQRFKAKVIIKMPDMYNIVKEVEGEIAGIQDEEEYTKKYIELLKKKVKENKENLKESNIDLTIVYDEVAKEYVIINADTIKYLR